MMAGEIASPLQALIGSARQAEADAEWAKAAYVWQAVREQFPECPHGFLAGAECLLRQGNWDDAATVLSMGVERFPNDEWIAVEQAWLVLNSGRVSQAVERGQEIRRRFPGNLGGFLIGALASRNLGRFDEAEQLYRDALSRFSDSEDLLVNFARCADERQANDEAIERWQIVCARFPELDEGYVRLGSLLFEAGRLEEANQILTPAVTRFPKSEAILCSYAKVAHARRDWSEALARWERVLKEFRSSREARHGAAEALNALGRFGEAIQVLEPVRRMFPDDREIAILHGWLAIRRRDFAEAETVWRDVLTRFPELPEVHRGYALALTETGRLNESQATLKKAMVLFPCDTEIAIDSAGVEAAVAATRRDWLCVIEIWKDACLRFPDSARPQVGLGRALRDAGDLDQSAQILNRAVSRFPWVVEAEVHLALTLSAQRQWPSAIKLWESLRQRYPNDSQVRAGISEVLDHVLIDRAAGLGEPFDIPPCLLVTGDNASETVQKVRAILNRFESLGNSCEFAIVQRLFQVNNLSLLRWAAMPHARLVQALDANFEGVGDPDQTLVSVTGDEYMTEDKRFSLHSHTFTRASAEPIERFAPDQCRRIRWLRGKLLKSLHAAAKVFVYVYHEGVKGEELMTLYAAICRYCSDVVLLCVTLQNADHPAGSIVQHRRGLFVGYIDRLSTTDISVDGWVKLCKQVSETLGTDNNRAVG